MSPRANAFETKVCASFVFFFFCAHRKSHRSTIGLALNPARLETSYAFLCTTRVKRENLRQGGDKKWPKVKKNYGHEGKVSRLHRFHLPPLRFFVGVEASFAVEGEVSGAIGSVSIGRVPGHPLPSSCSISSESLSRQAPAPCGVARTRGPCATRR